MGIPKFFPWFKRTFPESIYTVKSGKTLKDISFGSEFVFSLDTNVSKDENNTNVSKDDTKDNIECIEHVNPSIDNLLIDFAGVVHPVAQKIYQYGDKKENRSFLTRSKEKKLSPLQLQLKYFNAVMQEIERIVNVVSPTKRVIIGLDGCSGLAKMKQQRQRRFVAARDRENARYPNAFDSNCISTGTSFMDHLSKYADWYIRKSLTTQQGPLAQLEVIFSSEKVPGEGEHKLLGYMRTYGTDDESYCIHSMDADLIMLELVSPLKKLYILRDEIYIPDVDYHLIDMNVAKTKLIRMLDWTILEEDDSKGNLEEDTPIPNPERTIRDFVFFCFLNGTDFTPKIKTQDIEQNIIESMIFEYKKLQSHILRRKNGKIIFHKKTLANFFSALAENEEKILINKAENKDKYIADSMLEKCVYVGPLSDVNNNASDNALRVDMKKLKALYYEENFPDNTSVEKICHEYLKGLLWVMEYYTRGMPSWTWMYPYFYGPFLSDLAEHVSSFEFTEFELSQPLYPFVQLISVLPPSSANLLPAPLDAYLKGDEMKPYCPTQFCVDASGRKQEYEGVVIIPHPPIGMLKKVVAKSKISDKDKRRNYNMDESLVYNTSDSHSELFKSFYGDFISNVVVREIVL